MQSSHHDQRHVAVGGLRAAMPLIVAACALLLFQPLLAQSTITVTIPIDNLSNNGDCSLREAIESARRDVSVDACAAGNGADTILLPAGIYSITLTGASEDDNQTGDYDLTGNIQITGAGAGSTVIAGGELDRVFHIHPNATVQLMGVGLNGGLAPEGEAGGAILNEGQLTIHNSLIEASQTDDGQSCLPAEGCNLVPGQGGGIANTRTLTITTSTVRGNLTGRKGVYYSGLPVTVYHAPGGGIYQYRHSPHRRVQHCLESSRARRRDIQYWANCHC